MSGRRLGALALLVALGVVPPPAAADDAACIVALNAAGARVGRLVTRRFLACVRDASSGRQTAASCLAADPKGRIAGALARTRRVFADRCAAAPAFGPESADAVNAAFGSLLHAGP